MPRDPNDYIHRIGRTARAGGSGKVINLVSNTDYSLFSKILRTYRTFEMENLDIPGLIKTGFKKQRMPGSCIKRKYVYRSKRSFRSKRNYYRDNR
jgi:superfamily II DNA/RNA helicase